MNKIERTSELVKYLKTSTSAKELSSLRQAYGEEEINKAWAILTEKEKDRIKKIAREEPVETIPPRPKGLGGKKESTRNGSTNDKPQSNWTSKTKQITEPLLSSSDKLSRIFDQIDDLAEKGSEDSEIADQLLLDYLETNETIRNKVGNCISYIKFLDGLISSIETNINSLLSTLDQYRERKEKLKKNLWIYMEQQDINKVETEYGIVRKKNNGGVLPLKYKEDFDPKYDIDKVEGRFVKTKKELDIEAIRAILNNGENIPFVEYGERKSHIQIS